jgi:hypothetical protein
VMKLVKEIPAEYEVRLHFDLKNKRRLYSILSFAKFVMSNGRRLPIDNSFFSLL